MKAPDNVFAQFCAELEAAKQSGKLDKNTFKKILGLDMTWPGFAEDALKRLEELGCSREREYYEAVRSGWQQEHEQQMRNVAEWYIKQNFDRKKVRARDWKIENLTREELTELCQSLLRDGIISEPEQFSAAISSILEKTSRA